MINDQMSSISGRLLRPKLLLVEPLLVPQSQALGSAWRASVVAAHCSWALFYLASAARMSAGALFSDIKGAYYHAIRENVVGCSYPDALLERILFRLQMPAETAHATVNFVNSNFSLLAQGGAGPAVVGLLRDMKSGT